MNTGIRRILLLEDDPEWTRRVKRYLGSKYELVATPSLPRAKELLASEDFHLAIIDLSLVPQQGNDASGFQFISYIRSSDLLSDLPVMVLTAYDSVERMRTAFKDFRVYDFLSKGTLDRVKFQSDLDRAIATGGSFREPGEVPRALIVEDTPQWQSRIKRVLEEEGCQVDIASNYSDAIDRLTSQAYHLVTVDIRLKELDSSNVGGRELVDVMRRLRLSPDVIFISAYGTPSEIGRAAFEFGARDFIDKGDFQPQRLRLRVRRILRRIIFVNVILETGESEVLQLGTEYPLTVSISPSRPRGVLLSRSFTRPVTSGHFELELSVQPYDLDVIPGSTQPLTVLPNDTSEPTRFQIIPRVAGRIELVIDVLFQGITMIRMSTSREVAPNPN